MLYKNFKLSGKKKVGAQSSKDKVIGFSLEQVAQQSTQPSWGKVIDTSPEEVGQQPTMPLHKGLLISEPSGRIVYRNKGVICDVVERVSAISKLGCRHALLCDSTDKYIDNFCFDASIKNYDSAIFSLVSTLRRISVVDFSREIDRYIDAQFFSVADSLVYPDMPVYIAGFVHDDGCFDGTIQLVFDGFSLDVIIENERQLIHKLKFINGNQVFIIGILDLSDKGSVRAGAIIF